MKKILSAIVAMVMTSACFPLFAACGEPPCEHDYVETQVAATCTEEGYNLFTCSKCNDSYKGDKVTPTTNHSGIGTCKVCGAEFDPMWKEFIDKNSGNDPNNRVVIGGAPDTVVLTYSGVYDCIISAVLLSGNEALYQNDIIMFAYNSYDKTWEWEYSTEIGLVAQEDSGVTGEAGGSFSEWSSRSNSLNCSSRTGLCKNDSNLLDTIKKLYNNILNKANAKLQECGYNISMENFGLSQ